MQLTKSGKTFLVALLILAGIWGWVILSSPTNDKAPEKPKAPIELEKF